MFLEMQIYIKKKQISYQQNSIEIERVFDKNYYKA